MTQIGQFKGNPTITLNPEEPDPRRRFTFGADKARLILGNIEAITAFADANPPRRKTPAGDLAAENARLAAELDRLRAQVNGNNARPAASAATAPADILNHIRR